MNVVLLIHIVWNDLTNFTEWTVEVTEYAGYDLFVKWFGILEMDRMQGMQGVIRDWGRSRRCELKLSESGIFLEFSAPCMKTSRCICFWWLIWGIFGCSYHFARPKTREIPSHKYTIFSSCNFAPCWHTNIKFCLDWDWAFIKQLWNFCSISFIGTKVTAKRPNIYMKRYVWLCREARWMINQWSLSSLNHPCVHNMWMFSLKKHLLSKDDKASKKKRFKYIARMSWAALRHGNHTALY